MPKIEQYNSQIDSPGPVGQPNQNGEAFGQQVAEQAARTGQAMAGAGDALLGVAGHIEKRAGEAEVSDLTVTMAKRQAEYTQKLQETLKNSTPGDQNITQKFLDDYRATSDKIREGINTRAGQEYFSRVDSHLESHFAETANAGQAELAGVQAKQNILTSNQAMEATVMADPGSYWTSVKDFAATNIDAVARGKLDAKQILALQTETHTKLAEAAVRGWIFSGNQGPQEAMNQLQEGKWDKEFDSSVKYRLMQEAKVGIAGVEAKTRQAQRDQEDALRAKQELTKNQLLARLVDPKNPDGKYSVNDILKSNLDFTDKKMFINMMDQSGQSDTERSKANFNSMLGRALLPEGDPHRLFDANSAYQAAAQGQITFAQAQNLASVVQGKRTDQGQLESHLQSEFLKTATPQIGHWNPGLNQYDVESTQRLYKFNYLVQKKIASQKAANKPVEDLFDPSSKDFLGQYIPRFQVGMDNIMDQMLRNSSPTPKEASFDPTPAPSVGKRLPGETPAQYLKRTKH